MLSSKQSPTMPRGLRRLLHLVLFCPLSKGLQVGQQTASFVAPTGLTIARFMHYEASGAGVPDGYHSLSLHYLLLGPCWERVELFNKKRMSVFIGGDLHVSIQGTSL